MDSALLSSSRTFESIVGDIYVGAVVIGDAEAIAAATGRGIKIDNIVSDNDMVVFIPHTRAQDEYSCIMVHSCNVHYISFKEACSITLETINCVVIVVCIIYVCDNIAPDYNVIVKRNID